jgi:hypothetical protein
MPTRRKIGKKKPAKRPAKRREPRDELDILADELFREAKRERNDVDPTWEKYMQEVRKRVKPMSIQELREMMIKDGVDPANNEFSRAVIEMREE